MCENMYREQDALFDKGIIEKLELVQVNKKQKIFILQRKIVLTMINNYDMSVLANMKDNLFTVQRRLKQGIALMKKIIYWIVLIPLLILLMSLLLLIQDLMITL